MAKRLLIVLSVALNTAFVATWLVRSLPAKAPAPPSPSECPLRQALHIEDADWQAFQARQAEFRARSRVQCREINRLRSQLIDLLAAPQTDARLIRAKQDETLAAQQHMQSLVIDYLLAEKKHLNAGQQRALFEVIRKRCGCSGQDALMGQGASVGTAGAVPPGCPEK